MPAVAKRTRRGPHTRQQILDASLRLFSERGFARTTVRDIARQAGITDAAIYYHFDSKRELLEALVEERGFLNSLQNLARLQADAPLQETLHWTAARRAGHHGRQSRLPAIDHHGGSWGRRGRAGTVRSPAGPLGERSDRRFSGAIRKRVSCPATLPKQWPGTSYTRYSWHLKRACSGATCHPGLRPRTDAPRSGPSLRRPWTTSSRA